MSCEASQESSEVSEDELGDVAARGLPSVAILMATFNGSHYLSEQIESIARQKDVKIVLFVSDDNSTDGTVPFIKTLCDQFGVEYRVLPTAGKFGGAARNFFRLLKDVDAANFQYFSFSDQDDIWQPEKLILSIRALQNGTDAVSSDVTAFWPNGKRKDLIKSQPQRKFDFLFESAGPGCTFVLSAPLFIKLQELMRTHEHAFNCCALHDWAIYAVTRSLGYSWKILPASTLLYRQHSTNVVGARIGLGAILKRFDLIREGWVYHQIQAVIDLVERCSPIVDADKIRDTISQPSLMNRVRLCFMARHLRRKFADRCFMIFLFGSGLFWPKCTNKKLQ